MPWSHYYVIWLTEGWVSFLLSIIICLFLFLSIQSDCWISQSQFCVLIILKNKKKTQQQQVIKHERIPNCMNRKETAWCWWWVLHEKERESEFKVSRRIHDFGPHSPNTQHDGQHSQDGKDQQVIVNCIGDGDDFPRRSLCGGFRSIPIKIKHHPTDTSIKIKVWMAHKNHVRCPWTSSWGTRERNLDFFHHNTLWWLLITNLLHPFPDPTSF